MADDPNKKKPKSLPPQLKRVGPRPPPIPPPPPVPPPTPRPKVTAEELGIGDDWLNAVDEWDARLDLPTNAAGPPPRPPVKPPPVPASLEDPLMRFIASDMDIDFQSEGEALGPGLGLDPAPPAEFQNRQSTVAVPQEQLLEKLLKGGGKPVPAPLPAVGDEENDEFETAPDTKSVSFEKLQKMAQDAADFSELDGGKTTAVQQPDEDLLTAARRSQVQKKATLPLPPEDDYEVEIERPPTQPPRKTASSPTGRTGAPLSRPNAPAARVPPASPQRVARPLSPRQVSQPVPVANKPRTTPPPLRMPKPPVHTPPPPTPPPATRLDEIDVDVDLGDERLPITAVAPPIGGAPAMASVEDSQLDEEPITNVRDLSAPIPVAPQPSGPVQLPPRVADRIDLGPEPEHVRPAYEPPPLATSELALPDEAQPTSTPAREEIAKLLAAERAAGSPATAQLLLDEGRLYERIGRTQEADARFAEAADAGSPAALRAVARRALGRGGSENALAQLARAENHCTPAEKSALELARAALLRGRGDRDGAHAALERATQDDAAARLCATLGQFELALAGNRDADAAAQMMRLESGDGETQAALGLWQARLQERLGDDAAARTAYQAAWDAGEVAAGVGATRVALRQGDPEIAAAAHAVEAKGAPSCETALARRAAVFYRRAGDDAHALALLADRAEPLALETFAEAALALGRPDDAIGALEKLAQVEGDPGRQALALVRAGELRESMGDTDGAAAIYERSLQLAPSQPARRGIERTSAEHPDAQRRANALSAAAAADPARAPVLHTRVARVHAGSGDADEARNALSRALAAQAGFAPALFELAALEAAAGHPGAIGDALEAAAAANPDAAAALLESAADAAWRASDGETALRRATIAARADGAARALTWAVLGDEARLLGAEAERAEEAAFAASLHHRCGWALAAGDSSAAAEAFRAALAVAPAHPAAAAALGQILGGEGRFGDWAEMLRARAAAVTGGLPPFDRSGGIRAEAAASLVRAACAFEYEARDFARALAAYADADALFPRALGVRDGLFRTARLEGDADRVAQLAALEAESAPSIAGRAALLALAAAALERKGEHAHAATRYGASLEAEPSPLVDHARTYALRRSGQFGPLSDAALAELKHAEDGAAKLAAYDRLASIDEHDRGDPASAALAYESMLELSPGHQSALRALERYFQQADDRHAELANIYLQLGSSLTDPAVAVAVWLERARLRTRLEGASSALDDYRAALERDRLAVPALLALLAHAREAGDHEQACALHLLLAEAYAEDARAGAAAHARGADDLVALGREVEALERFRAASDLGPDHLPAQLARFETALRAGAMADACAAAEALAACARVRKHQIEWSLCAAVIAEVHLEDFERARVGYERVLSLEESHVGAFGRLRRVLERNEKWAELAALLEARIAHESEGYRVVELNLALAEIFSARLGDATRARQHLAEATRLHPTNVAALRVLVDLEWRGEHWQEASETLIKLARLERDPARLRDVFFKLGVLYADHLPDPKKAAGAFGRALSLAPTDREIVLRLSDLFVREKDWQNALTATVRLVELETQPPARIEWLLRQAEILRDGYNDARHAADALRKAADIDPRDLRPVEAMAKLFQGDVPSKRIHLDRALNAARGALGRDAFDLEGWNNLARIFEWLESRDGAQAAAQVLALFGTPGARAASPFAPMWEGLAKGEARDTLFPQTVPAGFRNLFGLVEETLAKIMRLDSRRHGIDKRTRQQKGTPLANLFATMGAKIGYAQEIELHVSDSHPELCVAEPGDTPLVVLGAGLVRGAGEPHLRFLVGRTLYLLATRMAIPARLAAEELGLLVGGIVWQFVPDYVHPSLPQAALYESAQRMAKLLPRNKRQPLMPYALECSGDLDFEKLTQGALAVGNRAGLCACGDLGAALDMLVRMAQPAATPAGGGAPAGSAGRRGGLPPPVQSLRGEALLRACRGNAQVAELLRFVASGDIGEIRRLLS